MHVFNNKVHTIIIGSPGSGKTTLSAKIVEEANRKDVPVYSNFPILGACQVNMKNVIEYNLGESVLIIDEAALEFNSRNTKAFTPAHNHWFAMARHFRTQIFIFVQNWTRVDIVLRELASEVVQVRKGIFHFSTYTSFHSAVKLIVDKDGYATEFKNVFKKIKWRFFWRRKYYHMFDSYYVPPGFKDMEPEPWDESLFPEKKKRVLRFRKRGTGDLSPVIEEEKAA